MVIVGIIFLLAIPSAIFEDDFEIGDHLIGAMIISVPFFIIGEISRIFIKKKYGEDFRGIEIGDTILMIAAGALLGTQAVIVSALLGIIVCAIIGIIHYMATGDKTVAFGPGLAIGIAISALWGKQIANWYLGMLVVEETVS
jgi:leader peptidase (prepilin peptidase)/N-methyltransferase